MAVIALSLEHTGLSAWLAGWLAGSAASCDVRGGLHSQIVLGLKLLNITAPLQWCLPEGLWEPFSISASSF